eukprot:scaffold7039_cov255-Pinguiococcus_pyrenoidosus.AAC.4
MLLRIFDAAQAQLRQGSSRRRRQVPMQMPPLVAHRVDHHGKLFPGDCPRVVWTKRHLGQRQESLALLVLEAKGLGKSGLELSTAEPAVSIVVHLVEMEAQVLARRDARVVHVSYHERLHHRVEVVKGQDAAPRPRGRHETFQLHGLFVEVVKRTLQGGVEGVVQLRIQPLELVVAVDVNPRRAVESSGGGATLLGVRQILEELFGIEGAAVAAELLHEHVLRPWRHVVASIGQTAEELPRATVLGYVVIDVDAALATEVV